jgi:ribonuclease HIII
VNDALANRVPGGLRRLLEESGAEISFGRHIDYGAQYRVTCGSEAAVVNVYTSGKVSTGGKPSPLRDLIENWRLAQDNARANARRANTEPAEPDRTSRVGADEAGKGDYFGPLVVAGVRVLGEEKARELRRIGARDSKTLSILGATNLARHLLEALGSENTRVVVLHPREYEARRRATGNNVSKLLAEVNVQIFEELGSEVELFVVDEFGKAARSYIEPRLPPGVRLVVRPRAEDDVAVAAASVLARARYLEEMEALSGEVGFELPRGATHVLEVAQWLVEERGLEGLKQVAKVHFGTTAQILEALGEEKAGE